MFYCFVVVVVAIIFMIVMLCAFSKLINNPVKDLTVKIILFIFIKTIAISTIANDYLKLHTVEFKF